ncbi:MAG: SulP family inorganic anion transporter [Bacteroidota bacterium]
MSSHNQQNFFSNLRYDLPSSIVVFLVALPLCLGIALASGAPLFSGIIAGIVGGTIVALISRSSLGVSGPAAGLIAIVISSIEDLGSFEAFLLAVVIAGVIQVILGLLKAGVIGYYFPSSVIKGMLSGIGILIILKQIPHAFGYDKDPEGDFAFIQKDGHNTLSELGYALNNITIGAVIITVVSLAILILWERPFIKRIKSLSIIQGPLLVVLAGVGLNLFFANYDQLAISTEHLVNIPVPDSLEGFFGQFALPDFSQWNNGQTYVIALTIAVVASIETLLSVEATDKLDPNKRVTPTSRELLAQGAGNIVSGSIGGLPITQVIVRSSANIQSGAKSRASAFIHGIFLLVSAMTIPQWLNLIPYASLAAILLVIGYKLAKPQLFFDMFKQGKTQFIPFVVTILGIVFSDLLIGIGLGMVVAIFQILWNNYRTPYHFDPDNYVKGEPVKIEFSEDVSFLNKASILHMFNKLPNGAHVVIDASKTKNLHPDVHEIMDDFSKNAPSRNITFEVIGGLDKQPMNSERHFKEKVSEEPVKKKAVGFGALLGL